MVRKIVLSLIAVLVLGLYAFAQNKQVSGTVSDANGNPVAGATVMVDGTSIGTTTNAAGQYSLSAPADGTLSVTFIGYVGQQLPIAGKSRIDVTMHEDTQAIDDVIVVAFGTSKKEAFTGSMSIVVMGAVFVDIKGYPLSSYIPGGRNAGRVVQVHGGVSRNIVEDIANVELRPTFVSLVDNTSAGADIVKKLQSHKVDTRYIRTTPDGMGMWLAIFDNTGDVTASISKRPDLSPIADILDEQGDEIFSQADSILLEIDMEKDIVKRTFALAEKHRKPVYAVVSNMSIAIERRDFLRSVHCFICNQQEAGILFSENYDGLSPDEMLPILRDKIRGAQIHRMVVTMGAQGAVFATLDGEDGYCPAKKVDVKDTTGAGDAFFAGAVIGQTYGKTMMESCEIGTRLAASVITTGENVCPRYLPSEFGLDVSTVDDAQIALEF